MPGLRVRSFTFPSLPPARMAFRESRLRFIWPDGATAALNKLGWIQRPHDYACIFTKELENRLVQVLSFRKAKVVTQLEVFETIQNTTGIEFEHFMIEYVRYYGEDGPPVVPM
jgi:hypothetical protein